MIKSSAKNYILNFCSKCGESTEKGLKLFDPFFKSFLCSNCYKEVKKIAKLRFSAIFGVVILFFGLGFLYGKRYYHNNKPLAYVQTTDNINNSPKVYVQKTIQKRSSFCGALTKSGKACKRLVSGGGFCWQHRGKISVNEKEDPKKLLQQ